MHYSCAKVVSDLFQSLIFLKEIIRWFRVGWDMSKPDEDQSSRPPSEGIRELRSEEGEFGATAPWRLLTPDWDKNIHIVDQMNAKVENVRVCAMVPLTGCSCRGRRE